MKKILRIIGTLAVLAGCVYLMMRYGIISSYMEWLTGTDATEEAAEAAARVSKVSAYEMTFPFTEPAVPPEGYTGVYYEAYDTRGTVISFYKEQGAGLWLPCESSMPTTDGIYLLGSDGILQRIDPAFCTINEDRREVGIAFAYMNRLENGDYYIVRTGADQMEEEGCPWYAVHVEDAVSFNSPRPGIATVGDFRSELFFNKEKPEDMEIHLYNIGDNEVLYVYNEDGEYKQLRPEKDYSLADGGNTVILSKEYLKSLPLKRRYRFQFQLADGSRIKDELNIVILKGELERPQLEVPLFYRRSEGGDFSMRLSFDETGAALKAVNLSCFDEQGIEFAHYDITEYANPENGKLVIPEERMNGFSEGDYGIGLDYKIGDYSTYNWYVFRIVAD